MPPLSSPELREQARGLTQLLAAFRHADEVLATAELAEERIARLGPELAALEAMRATAEAELAAARADIAAMKERIVWERANLETALAAAKELHGRDLAVAAEHADGLITGEQARAESALSALRASVGQATDEADTERARIRARLASAEGEHQERVAALRREIDTLDAQLAKLKADLRALGIDPEKLLATVPTGG